MAAEDLGGGMSAHSPEADDSSVMEGGFREPAVPANVKCPRCGFYVGNVFACAVCRDRRVLVGGIEPEVK